MKVLIGCEFSGVVRQAFRDRGHDAWSCDLLPAEDGSQFHIQDDVRDVLDAGWSLAIFHPPCTYLALSGIHWNNRVPGRTEKTEAALAFVQDLMDAPIPHIAIENPVGVISTRIRKPDQYIQPFEFGHDASKKTGLWLVNLPPLVPTVSVPPRLVNGKPRWSNQTDSGQNRLAPSPDRWKVRSETYAGIAQAFASQWGPLL